MSSVEIMLALMYQRIAPHASVRELWAATLYQRGMITTEWSEELVRQHTAILHGVLESLQPEAYCAKRSHNQRHPRESGASQRQ